MILRGLFTRGADTQRVLGEPGLAGSLSMNRLSRNLDASRTAEALPMPRGVRMEPFVTSLAPVSGVAGGAGGSPAIALPYSRPMHSPGSPAQGDFAGLESCLNQVPSTCDQWSFGSDLLQSPKCP